MSKDSIHTFAIGDVHGRADLLEEMLLGIGQKSVRERFAYRIVFLGDIIDRGPESCRALDLVVETLRELPGSKLIRGTTTGFPFASWRTRESSANSHTDFTGRGMVGSKLFGPTATRMERSPRI